MPDQRDQAVRDAENDVEVPDGQQLLSPIAEPLLACIDLTLRAMAIAAGAESDGLIPATGTSITMTTESGGAAAFDSSQRFDVLRGDPLAASFDEAFSAALSPAWFGFCKGRLLSL